jgi:hypothetical protein
MAQFGLSSHDGRLVTGVPTPSRLSPEMQELLRHAASLDKDSKIAAPETSSHAQSDEAWVRVLKLTPQDALRTGKAAIALFENRRMTCC